MRTFHWAVLTECPHSLKSRSEEHTSELQSRSDLVCRLLLEKKELLHTPRRRLSPLTVDVLPVLRLPHSRSPAALPRCSPAPLRPHRLRASPNLALTAPLDDT